MRTASYGEVMFLYRRYITSRVTGRLIRQVLQGFLLTGLWSVSALAASLPTVSLSVLQYGTAHWELDYIQRQGLDRSHGFLLELHPVANLPASRLALTSESVDGAVADLLWVQSRYEAGAELAFVPFSSRIGELVVAPESSIGGIHDLVGKRIGVAGGPDSKGWILLQRVAATQGLDLAASNQVQYAAPPLLSEALKRGRLDAVVTYWHFAARLQAEGAGQSLMPLSDLLSALSLTPNLPVLGYVFREDWRQQHGALLDRFALAVRQAKIELAASPAAWERVRPLMRAPDDRTYDALRAGFVAGTPEPLNERDIAALRQLLVLVGAEPNHIMTPSLFYREVP